MLSRSESNPGRWVVDAGRAQVLRGGSVFGAVAFHDGGALTPDRLEVEPGYADCLPILGGGVWRDPRSPRVKETLG